MREVEGTYEEQEERAYKGCTAFLEDEGSINAVNKSLGQLVEDECYAQASGIKRAMIDYYGRVR